LEVPSSTIIDLGRLALSHGEGARLDLPVRLDPLELGGQVYALVPDTVQARIDVSRPSRGYAFRLRFPMRLAGPCMRCLEPAQVEAEVDAREIDQRETEDEELRSPYVEGEELDVGRWAHDAAVLALPLPVRVLCRPDCAGLCPVCGESLNDADPAAHEHDTAPDPRWDKLNDLKLD
jgi:uncharacterized protein